jgi:hypothetical protein
MKDEVKIFNTENPEIKYNLWEFWRLPYTLYRPEPPTLPAVEEQPNDDEDSEESNSHISRVNTTATESKHITPISSTTRSPTFQYYGEYCVTVQIKMKSDFGLSSWGAFEAIIEVLAVGIYLYATFVLTSTIFLNADRAVGLTAILALCQCAIRILGLLI